MADLTRRYDADSSASYVLAIILLMEYARDHPGEQFVIYPMTAAEMLDGGLFISGADLAGPAAVLAGVPGLAQYDPGAEEGALARLARCAGRVGDPG